MKTKVKEIYEAMANKELSFGCILEDDLSYHYTFIRHAPWNYLYTIDNHLRTRTIPFDTKTIGHPVMCNDVLAWRRENDICCVQLELLSLWTKLREPIEAQNKDCISYIHSLIN